MSVSKHGQISGASVAARALLLQLVRCGLRDLVLCPGSRSQAFALEAAALESADILRLHVRVDERSAAFFALGLARETGVPAAVLTTSGSAVANLLPAVVEADAARVPLLLLTADRPPELHGKRANQTLAQQSIFGGFVRESLDFDVPSLVSRDSLERVSQPDFALGGITVNNLQSRQLRFAEIAQNTWFSSLGETFGRPAGPVQINLRLRDPLATKMLCLPDKSYYMPDLELSEKLARANREIDIFHAKQETGAIPANLISQETTLDTDIFFPGSVPKMREFCSNTGFQAQKSGKQISTAPTDKIYTLDTNKRTVIFAGSGAPQATTELAAATNLPLLAEVVSGVRFGPEAIACYKTLLAEPETVQLIERVLVFGHPTLSREISALLAASHIETVVIDPHPGTTEHPAPAYNPHGTAAVFQAVQLAADANPDANRRWLAMWRQADRALLAERSTAHAPDLAKARQTGYRELNEYAREELAAKRTPITRELLAEAVWQACWPHDRLVVAASRLVRVLDSVAAPRPVRVHANRGLAGIDGTVATALGVAAAAQSGDEPRLAAGVTRVLVGDLALLHDAGSLAFTPGEPQPRIQIFVGNDCGGTIFDGLEVAQVAEPDAFNRVVTTPHRVDIASLAATYGWNYRKISTRAELEATLTAPVSAPELIEIPLT
ncbi:MAG: thiamine pyrophosphate-binding protein [Microbacteriaceae bacterium]|nr:thiamine pyrophosphate-binding protein [Microbacteriaceae bacterium]